VESPPGEPKVRIVKVPRAVLALVAALVAAGFVGGWAIGRYATPKTETKTGAADVGTAAQAITPAPAFSMDELDTLPTDNWITNGGSLANQRYSPVDQIDTSNVENLKGVWLTHLGSATAAKYSAEGQPIVYQGIIYLPSGADDVFALDADTGMIIWKYTGNLDQRISTVCCGWISRGVALGDGKVYIGRLDGKLVALDQKTG